MIGKKYLIPVCLIITFLTLLITILFINGKNFDLESIPSEEETYTDGSWEISGVKRLIYLAYPLSLKIVAQFQMTDLL